MLKDRSFSQPPQTLHHTLGRFSKSTNRLPTTSGGASGQYEHEPELPYGSERQSAGAGYAVTSQTLPRNDHHRLQRSRPLHSSTINVSIVNTVSPSPAAKSTPVAAPLVNTGPVKPARTYKALNRSKSFNVHGLNGTNDPSPIYLEKLGRGQPTTGGAGGGLYRSNFHLDAGSGQSAPKDASVQLKSPSIVNLISRSTRDLTQAGQYEDVPAGNRVLEYYPGSGVDSAVGPHTLDKKNVFLRNLQNRAPELYRTLHGAELGSGSSSPSKEYLGSYITREQEHLLGSRSPATLTKDTASIARRGSSSAEDYPDAANAKKSYYRKTAGRGLQAFEAEAHTAAPSRYRGDSDLKYQDVHGGPNISGNGTVDGVVIELRSNS
uniref:Uncharacterized protein n=1 Tax=Anopheles atroparvus TaxID=41427 RepID=A0A182J5R0_ANOAO